MGEGIPPILMDSVCSWNVRGLNSPRKQRVVRDFLAKHSVGLVGLLETKVKAAGLGSLYQVMFNSWCFTTNLDHSPKGRIIVAWKPGVWDVDIRGGSSQWVHCFVRP